MFSFCAEINLIQPTPNALIVAMVCHAFVGGDPAVELFLRQLSGEVFRADSPEGGLDPPDGVLPQAERARGNDVTDELDPIGRTYAGLVVQVQVEMLKKELPDLSPIVGGGLLIRREEDNIVHVPRVKTDVENMLAELIQLVEVDIREELAGEIADWHTHVGQPVLRLGVGRTHEAREAELLSLAVDDLIEKPQQLLVFNADL